MQTSLAANAPRGQARPGWKVLRVLGNLVGAQGFDFESSEEVRQSLVGSALSGEVLSDLSFACEASPSADLLISAKGFELTRIGDVPIYRSDSLVRHAPSLQEMPCSSVPKARMNPADIAHLGLAQGSKVRVSQEGKAGGLFDLVADTGVARGVLRLSTGFGLTSDLGGLIAAAQVEAA